MNNHIYSPTPKNDLKRPDGGPYDQGRAAMPLERRLERWTKRLVTGAAIAATITTGAYCHRQVQEDARKNDEFQRFLLIADQLEQAPEAPHLLVIPQTNDLDGVWRKSFGVPINSPDGKAILYDLCQRNEGACAGMPADLTQPDYIGPDEIPVQPLRATGYRVGDYCHALVRIGEDCKKVPR